MARKRNAYGRRPVRQVRPVVIRVFAPPAPTERYAARLLIVPLATRKRVRTQMIVTRKVMVFAPPPPVVPGAFYQSPHGTWPGVRPTGRTIGQTLRLVAEAQTIRTRGGPFDAEPDG